MITNTRPSAFFEYVGEEPTVYRVRDGAEVEAFPKMFQPAEPVTGELSPGARQAARYLRWALVGLLPAGLGALVLAPAAALAAWRELNRAVEPVDQRRALAILGQSAAALLAALPLVYLLWLHF
jgi:hypothetical protein